MWGFMTASIVVAIACLMSSLAYALEFRTAVEEPAMFNVEEAIDDAIVHIAERLTGIPVTQMVRDAPDLFSLSEALVNSYGYDGDSFVVDIDVYGLKVRLGAAGIELWEAKRPEFLVWVTEERGLERFMIGQDSNVYMDRLLAASKRFGVPIQRPLMDLEDTLALSPAEIWGEFSGVVINASARYGTKHVLVIGDRPERQSLKYWLYEVNGDFKFGEIEGETPDDRLKALTIIFMQYARAMSKQDSAGVDRLLMKPPGSLGTQKQIVSGRWSVRVAYVDMIKLMELIDHVEAVATVSIAEMQFHAKEVTLVLQTDMTLAATDELISSFDSVQFISPLVYVLN